MHISPHRPLLDGMVDEKRIRQDFANRLKRLRVERGIPQEQLAHQAGLERSYISQVEKGGRDVRLTTIHKLAAALGVDPAKLITDESSD